MKHINQISVLCGVLLLSFVTMLEAAPAQSKFPSLKELRQTNVALDMEGFDFASGLRRNQKGRPNGNGLEMVKAKWSGSGFIASADGSVVTNYHVARRALHGFARFEDGSSYEIKHIRTYIPSQDLAILKIATTREFPRVKLGSTRNVQPLDTVLAVGNPLSGGISMTKGEVSRIDRDDNGRVVNIVHTAPIAPGNSGGPLYRGSNVVGVNASIRMARSQFTQFNNAIPIENVKQLLQKSGKRRHLLRSVFAQNALNILKYKFRQIDSVRGTVPAAQGKKSVMYPIKFTFNRLEDYCIVLESPGRDLAIMVLDQKGLIGFGDSRKIGVDGLLISNSYAKKVLVNVVNYDPNPANFGLQIGYINW